MMINRKAPVRAENHRFKPKSPIHVLKFILTLSMILFMLPGEAEMTYCEITYTLKGWSFVYKQYRGDGTVTCQNGEFTEVQIMTHGAGFTIGKSEIHDGIGVFSKVKSIDEIFGTYVGANGHAGAINSLEGWAITKGEVSLALYGYGRGIDIGISLDGFTIRPK